MLMARSTLGVGVHVIATAALLFSVCYCENETHLTHRGNEFMVGFLPSFVGNYGIQFICMTRSSESVNVSIMYSTSQIPTVSTNEVSIYAPLVRQWLSIVPGVTVPYGKPFQILGSSKQTSVFVSLIIRSDEMTASYLALPPRELLTKEYEYFSLSTTSSKPMYNAGLFLIGTQNNTEITLTNNSSTINEMESMFIEAYNLTGTRIVSDKPITVISGHVAGSVPSDGTLEQMAQQIPPTQLWGDTFMIVPMKGHEFGQIIKVLSSVDKTEIVHYCHQLSSVVLPKAGSVHEFFVPSTVSCYIKANNSVLVAQFPYSPNGNTDGDTTMILVASIDQYSNEFNFWTSGVLDDYISVIVPVDYVSNSTCILLDNVTLSDITNWEPIHSDGQTIVGYGRGLSVSEGSHTVSHNDSDGRLFVMVYGFGIRRAYGYPAGLTFDSSKVLGLVFSALSYHTTQDESFEVMVKKTREWKSSAHFCLNLYNNQKVVYSKIVVIQPEDSNINIELTWSPPQEGSNELYTVSLCCTNETLKDVCIHTEFNISSIVDNEKLVTTTSNIMVDATTISSISMVPSAASTVESSSSSQVLDSTATSTLSLQSSTMLESSMVSTIGPGDVNHSTYNGIVPLSPLSSSTSSLTIGLSSPSSSVSLSSSTSSVSSSPLSSLPLSSLSLLPSSLISSSSLQLLSLTVLSSPPTSPFLSSLSTSTSSSPSPSSSSPSSNSASSTFASPSTSSTSSTSFSSSLLLPSILTSSQLLSLSSSPWLVSYHSSPLSSSSLLPSLPSSMGQYSLRSGDRNTKTTSLLLMAFTSSNTSPIHTQPPSVMSSLGLTSTSQKFVGPITSEIPTQLPSVTVRNRSISPDLMGVSDDQGKLNPLVIYFVASLAIMTFIAITVAVISGMICYSKGKTKVLADLRRADNHNLIDKRDRVDNVRVTRVNRQLPCSSSIDDFPITCQTFSAAPAPINSNMEGSGPSCNRVSSNSEHEITVVVEQSSDLDHYEAQQLQTETPEIDKCDLTMIPSNNDNGNESNVLSISDAERHSTEYIETEVDNGTHIHDDITQQAGVPNPMFNSDSVKDL